MASQFGGLALPPSRMTPMATPPSAARVTSNKAAFIIGTGSIALASCSEGGKRLLEDRQRRLAAAGDRRAIHVQDHRHHLVVAAHGNEVDHALLAELVLHRLERRV